MSGQQLSAFLAWAIAGFAFLSALVVVYRRRDTPWQAMLIFLIGAVLLAGAGALAATHAADDPEGALPPTMLVVIIVARATATAIFLGLFIMISERPKWLLRLGSRWLGDE